MIKVWPKTGREIYWPSRTPGEWPEINSVGPLSRHFSYIFIEKKKKWIYWALFHFYWVLTNEPFYFDYHKYINSLFVFSRSDGASVREYTCIYTYAWYICWSNTQKRRNRNAQQSNSVIVFILSIVYTHTHTMECQMCISVTHCVPDVNDALPVLCFDARTMLLSVIFSFHFILFQIVQHTTTIYNSPTYIEHLLSFPFYLAI